MSTFKVSQTLLNFYVTQQMVYDFYIGTGWEPGHKINSPFRYDPIPSFSFKDIGEHNRPFIIWSDFGLEGVERHDHIGLVMEMFDLNTQEACKKIWDDLVLNKENNIPKRVIKTVRKMELTPRWGSWDKYNSNYWDKLHLTRYWTDRLNIFPISKLKRVDYIVWEWKDENPIYGYRTAQDHVFKAYRPLDENRDRFRGVNNSSILEGYEVLPRTANNLIINSSYKDSSCCWRMGLCSINPTSETSFRTLLKFAPELNQRFKNIYILFDNDTPGVLSSKYLAQQTGWTPIFIEPGRVYFDNGKFAKDPSDCVHATGNYFYLSEFFSNLNLTKYWL